MKHSSSRLVFKYWNERRGNRIAPERVDIEPGPIRTALGDTFILGRDAAGAYRFRLAGTRCCALFCSELKDTDFIGLWTRAERPGMLERITTAALECEGFIAGAAGYYTDCATIELELLLLPLRHRDPAQTRLLGVLAPVVPPYWLGATPVEAMACGTVRHLGAGSEYVAAPRLVPGTDSGRLRNGLIVYDGGRSKRV